MALALEPSRTVYRWDLDKTYLRTEFDTVRDLLRTAIEPAARKRTVPGASVLLREIRGTGPAGIYILSGSPEQMRQVLEAKLRLDGIRWDAFTLKPSLRNLMRGRFRFLKDQVSYKLASLLDARTHVEPSSEEVLFGDDAEADAFIYSLYADIGAGRVGTETLMAVLERARVYPEDIPQLVRLASRIPRRDAVRRIFIHLDRMSAPEVFAEFGHRVCPFFNYFQPAVVLAGDGGITPLAALRVGADIVLEHAFSPDALAASFFDLERRRYVGRDVAEALLEALESVDRRSFAAAAPVLETFGETLRRRLPELGDAAPIDRVAIDYVDLFSRDKERARAGRRRATRRFR
ncbi:MAG: phosphatase domain-containing protein [Myxococcota bacterium]